MEKLSDISWGIPNDKWINHKFELQSDVGEIARWDILIYLQNVIGCLKFLIDHPGFWHNQNYEPSYIFNENKYQVYNKIHTGE